MQVLDNEYTYGINSIESTKVMYTIRYSVALSIIKELLIVKYTIFRNKFYSKYRIEIRCITLPPHNHILLNSTSHGNKSSKHEQLSNRSKIYCPKVLSHSVLCYTFCMNHISIPVHIYVSHIQHIESQIQI